MAPYKAGDTIVLDAAMGFGYVTVSYTHLDVYKRQLLGGRLAIANALLNESTSPHCAICCLYYVGSPPPW